MSQKPKALLGVLSGLRGLIKPKKQSDVQAVAVSQTPAARPAPPPSEPEDWFRHIPVAPDSHGIRVQEVDSDEFVHEWGKTVAEEALAHTHDKGEAILFLERRLPNFDRRQPNRDRRAGNSDRRAHLSSGGGETQRDRRGAEKPKK